MKLSYDVVVEDLGAGRRGVVRTEEAKAIDELMKTKRANMCFEYETEEEAKKRVGAVMSSCKRVNKDNGKEVISYAKRGNKIYVIKTQE